MTTPGSGIYEGLASARARGRSKANRDMLEQAMKMYNAKAFTLREVTQTIYRYLTEGLVNMDIEKVIKLHECGYSVSQIAERIKAKPEEVRSVIAASWDVDKKSDMMQRKIAGRLGRR